MVCQITVIHCCILCEFFYHSVEYTYNVHVYMNYTKIKNLNGE